MIATDIRACPDPSEIEQYLLAHHAWVTSAEICERFNITDRQLRQVNDRPGLCSAFAVSGNKGFKHIAYATTAEWLEFKHRLRKHGISELVRVRDLGRRRSSVTRTINRSVVTYERDTGQAVMLLR